MRIKIKQFFLLLFLLFLLFGDFNYIKKKAIIVKTKFFDFLKPTNQKNRKKGI